MHRYTPSVLGVWMILTGNLDSSVVEYRAGHRGLNWLIHNPFVANSCHRYKLLSFTLVQNNNRFHCEVRHLY